MARAIIAIALLTLAGCASLSHGAVTWRGHTPGRINAKIVSYWPGMPTQGWLVASERDHATGHLSYTKWGQGGYRYRTGDYFQIRQQWDPAETHLGHLETKDGLGELCVVNPVHGGFQEGATFVITNAYDYCVRLGKK